MMSIERRLARMIAPAAILAALFGAGIAGPAYAQEGTGAAILEEEAVTQEDGAAPVLPADDPALTGETGLEPLPDSMDIAPGDMDAALDEAGALPDHDLSPWGMFLMADIVVKAVMIGLVIFSILTWTVWLAKKAELGRAKRRANDALAVLTKVRSIEEAKEKLQKQSGPAALLAQTAHEEMQLSGKGADKEGVKERIVWQLQRIEANAALSVGRGTGILATIGSTAPFIGLFGTVWGIMNSFIGIAESQTTNLAVVAPGIAEALLATGLGLVAAIPAVMIYNSFARAIARYRAQIADGSAQIMRLVSRDLDRMAAANSPAMAAE